MSLLEYFCKDLVQVIESYDVVKVCTKFIQNWSVLHVWPDSTLNRTITKYLWIHHQDDVVLPWLEAFLTDMYVTLTGNPCFSIVDLFVDCIRFCPRYKPILPDLQGMLRNKMGGSVYISIDGVCAHDVFLYVQKQVHPLNVFETNYYLRIPLNLHFI